MEDIARSGTEVMELLTEAMRDCFEEKMDMLNEAFDRLDSFLDEEVMEFQQDNNPNSNNTPVRQPDTSFAKRDVVYPISGKPSEGILHPTPAKLTTTCADRIIRGVKRPTEGKVNEHNAYIIKKTIEKQTIDDFAIDFLLSRSAAMASIPPEIRFKPKNIRQRKKTNDEESKYKFLKKVRTYAKVKKGCKRDTVGNTKVELSNNQLKRPVNVDPPTRIVQERYKAVFFRQTDPDCEDEVAGIEWFKSDIPRRSIWTFLPPFVTKKGDPHHL